MEIRGVKVPETIEELNALGTFIKISLEDFNTTYKRMVAEYGEDETIEMVAMRADFEENRLVEAYCVGIELLIGNTISEITGKLVRCDFVDGAIKKAIEKAYEKEGGDGQELFFGETPF